VKPGFPYSKAAFPQTATGKLKPRRLAKKRTDDEPKIAGEKPRQRSDKFARGGGTRDKKGSALTNITIGTPDAGSGVPFAAPPRAAAGPVGPAPGAPTMGGGFKTGGRIKGAYGGSSADAVNKTLARSESTGSDLRKWTAPRKFTDRMTAGALSGIGREQKADHVRKKR
jgi:hypothetical protein